LPVSTYSPRNQLKMAAVLALTSTGK